MKISIALLCALPLLAAGREPAMTPPAAGGFGSSGPLGPPVRGPGPVGPARPADRQPNQRRTPARGRQDDQQIAVLRLVGRQRREFSYECSTSRGGKYFVKHSRTGNKIGPLEGNRIGHSRTCVFLKYKDSVAFWRSRLPATTPWLVLLDGLMGIANCERQTFATQMLSCPR